MATRKITDGVSGWNNKTPFPKDRYQLRCIEEKFGTSQGGNPMITREWEILSTAPVQLGDRLVDVDGVKAMQYCITKVKNEDGSWDNTKSDKAFGRFRDELQTLGYSEDTIDDENPPLIAKGKVVDAIVYGKENKSFKAPTPEEKSKGARIGQPIKDASGKDIVTYQLQIETILGLSTVEAGRPY